MPSLSVSIVTYSPSLTVLKRALDSLKRAVNLAVAENLLEHTDIFLIDNGPENKYKAELIKMVEEIFSPSSSAISASVKSGHGNIGFGAGHNLAFLCSRSRFHLIMNPDVIMQEEAISNALKFLKKNPETGGLSPYAEDGSGKQQFLCKRFPSVFDLFLRGLMPTTVQNRFTRRLAHYEMRDLCSVARTIPDVPIISGCFMFLRRDKLEEAGGFSPRYFLYFEDFDLSLRLAKITRLAYVPEVKIIHFGGEAGKKGLWHILLFTRSAYTFFREHGWKFF